MKKSKSTRGNRLVIKNLSHTYTHQAVPREVFKNLNATFEQGKLYAIRGESGSGKTTLLSLLAALDQIQSGDIQFNRRSIREIGAAQFRLNYVNIVFQSFNLIKYLTARENVGLALDFRGRTAEPLTYLEQVGLNADEADRLIGKLSGGQMQRVAIARAIASDVPIILADEPTGNLDQNTEAKIIKLFQDLARRQQKIVIMVTHSGKVARCADVVLELEGGGLRVR